MSNRNEPLDIFNGIVIAFGFNIIAAGTLFFLAASIGQISAILAQMCLFAIAGIGIFQVLYIIPYAMKLKRDGQIAMMKGLIIGAVIVALLNSACWLSLTNAYK
ncbi:hypothetical protein [Merismopedia glauca]|uniref:Uncharacterized protein n=1 Tax=Merismopedia glauca CCAP 1448/3 TaxID=1296344 RepID=A0A2T1C7L4_9CYAN|nr:hypothetical protein [Merismopedia glauca]PSB04272.1 hypothetical protein C7B64_04745 [Merismopedia glauca CCAP 1448/3]